MLTCSGTVKVAFNIKPRSISFGRISRDAESVERTIEITRGDGGPLDPELMPVTNKNLTATLREVKAGETYELHVVAKPPWPNSSIRGNLILHTGVVEAPTQMIRVFGMVAPRLAAMPSRFRVPPGLDKELNLRARLVWSGDKPGHIVEATTTDPQSSVTIEEKDGQQMVILHVPPKYSPPRGRAYITIKTDDAAAPLLRIPVYASAARSAARRPIIRPRPPTPGRPTPVTPAKKGAHQPDDH